MGGGQRKIEKRTVETTVICGRNTGLAFYRGSVISTTEPFPTIIAYWVKPFHRRNKLQRVGDLGGGLSLV